MGSSKIRLCLLLVACCVLLECSDKSSSPPEIQYFLNQEIPLSLGSTIVLQDDGLELTFVQVNFDTRCLPGTNCLWPDLVEIRLKVVPKSGNEQYIDVSTGSTRSGESLEILRVDTLGYAFKLTNLDPANDSLISGATNSGYVATVVVGKSAPTKKFDGFLIQRVPTEDEAGSSLTHQIISAQALGDTLAIVVDFAQGCRTHYFDLLVGPEMAKLDTIVSASMWLRQFAGEDSCAAQTVRRTLRFDISPIKENYAQQFGDWECVRISIQPMSSSTQHPEQPIEAIYGLCDLYSHPPDLDAPSSFLIRALWTTDLEINATDADGDRIILSARDLPPNAQFVDRGDGSGHFRMTPAVNQRGIHVVRFFASDGKFIDSVRTSIVVVRPDSTMNSPPAIGSVAPQSTVEAGYVSVLIMAHDDDGDSLKFSAAELPTNSTLQDHLNGTAHFNFSPNYSQAGLHAATIIVSDGFLTDTGFVVVSVENRNRAPYFRNLERGLAVKQTVLLTTEFEVGDDDNDSIRFDFGVLPANATFTTIALNRYRLEFQPDTTQFGIFQFPLKISDGIDSAMAEIAVQVADANSLVYFDPVDSISMTEGEVLVVDVHAYSPQLGIDRMYTTNPDNFPGGVFQYLGNGIERCTFSPTFVAAGKYRVSVTAVDRLEEKTIWLNITVLEAGDQPPQFTQEIQYFALYDTDSLSRCVGAVDPDGDITVIKALELPPGSSFVREPNCTRFWFAASAVTPGLYSAFFLAYDPDIPLLQDTLEVQITVHVVQENHGSFVPGGIGNYWVYLHTTARGYDKGAYGSGESWSTYQTSIDSVEIVDSTIVDGQLLWTLSKGLWWFGTKFTNRGDTTEFFWNAPDHERLFYPNRPANRAVVPAGAFSTCYIYYSNNWSGPSSSYTFAPGVGLLRASQNSRGESPMACEYGCSWSSSSITLLRYRIR